MRLFVSIARAVAWRQLHNFASNLALLLPSLIFPLFFLVSFAGGLSRIAEVPGFNFPSGYTAFQFVWSFMQTAAFGGVFTGFAIAADFESGFARQLMLPAPSRVAIIAGYAAAGLVRAVITGAILFAAALLAGMQVDGGGLDIFGLVGLAAILNIAATLWGVGVALRFRSLQSGALMQTPVFLALFLAPVFVPQELLTGWIDAVAALNPITVLLEAGRGFISGQPSRTLAAFAAGAALAGVFAVWSLTGLRRAERAG